MAVVNAIGPPKSSPFKDASKIPLPDDPLVEVQANHQFEDVEEEEGEDSPGMMELSQQINAHMVVIDE
nr:hypothetical protein CFP56_02242 [Quercus suber]